ncbi:MAG: hypothetical protein VZR95_06790 [Alphaproteobacteria bacterium]
MRNLYYLLAVSCAFTLISAPSYAEEDLFGEEEDSFLAQQVAEPEVSEEQKNIPLSTFLSTRISDDAAKNINKAEKIFCYTVDYKPADYTGYEMDGLAVKGACGELSDTGKQLIQNALLHNNGAFSTNQDDCQVVPKIMLRYIYGPDHTDVLLSAPCYSLTFFHGSDIMSINAAPGAQIIDKIVKAYSGLEEKYLSPALLDQIVANGQIITQSQKEIVRRMSPTEAPIKKWNNEQQNEAATPAKASTPAAAPKKGWGNLK